MPRICRLAMMMRVLVGVAVVTVMVRVFVAVPVVAMMMRMLVGVAVIAMVVGVFVRVAIIAVVMVMLAGMAVVTVVVFMLVGMTVRPFLLVMRSEGARCAQAEGQGEHARGDTTINRHGSDFLRSGADPRGPSRAPISRVHSVARSGRR